MNCVHSNIGENDGECVYCPPRLRERCEGCTDGRHADCNRASWCNCECEGAVEHGDIGPENAFEAAIHSVCSEGRSE